VRTEDGEMPPVLELDVPLELFGPVPPDWLDPDVELLPPDGAEVPPVAAEALAVPHASAIRRITMANVERPGLPPCMGHGIGPLRATV
jgi:hypothetical protein